MFPLDHASLVVSDPGEAFALLEQRLGLVPTPTAGAAQRHGRVYLHRSYLEVSRAEGPPPPRTAQRFFFRFGALESATAWLRQRGLRVSHQSYRGVDGVWDDLTVEAPPGTPAAILVRRVLPPALAADWPPARVQPTVSGARQLLGLHLVVTELAAAVAFFQRLLDPGSGEESIDPRTGFPRVVLRWSGALLALRQGANPGVEAVLLGTAAPASTARFLAERGTAARQFPDGLWVEEALPGLAVGFAAQGA